MTQTHDHAPTAPAAPPSIRTGTTHRKPWVIATGSPATKRDKAIFYLVKAFDYEQSWLMDHAEVSLAKVVCNLRNFFCQDLDNTIELVQTYFNHRTVFYEWCPDSIRIAWEGVADFTPSLGIRDEKARAKQQKQLLEDEVIELLAWTNPGGRVLDDDLLRVFREWNPGIEVTPNAFSRAISARTGLAKLRSNGQDYWVGFHLPTADELAREGRRAA